MAVEQPFNRPFCSVLFPLFLRSIYVQLLSVPFRSVLCRAVPFRLRGAWSNSRSSAVRQSPASFLSMPRSTIRFMTMATSKLDRSASQRRTFERQCNVTKARSLLVSFCRAFRLTWRCVEPSPLLDVNCTPQTD